MSFSLAITKNILKLFIRPHFDNFYMNFSISKNLYGFAWIYICVSVNHLHLHGFMWPTMDSHKFALINLKLGIYVYMECVLRTIYMPDSSLNQCCACKWFGTYTPCKCKSHNEIYFIPCKTV